MRCVSGDESGSGAVEVRRIEVEESEHAGAFIAERQRIGDSVVMLVMWWLH